MKIAIIGATGNLGTLVAEELIERNHHVIGIAPAEYMNELNKGVEYRIADANDLNGLQQAIAGAEIVVSVFPPDIEHPERYNTQIKNVIEANKKSGAERLVAVVGSSVAITNTGRKLVESDYFQETTRHFYLAICDSINIFEDEKELNWSVIIPAAKMTRSITDRRRTYRTGSNELVTTDLNSMRYFDVSQISYFDFAYAIVDEVENPKHYQTRFTVGY